MAKENKKRREKLDFQKSRPSVLVERWDVEHDRENQKHLRTLVDFRDHSPNGRKNAVELLEMVVSKSVLSFVWKVDDVEDFERGREEKEDEKIILDQTRSFSRFELEAEELIDVVFEGAKNDSEASDVLQNVNENQSVEHVLQIFSGGRVEVVDAKYQSDRCSEVDDPEHRNDLNEDDSIDDQFEEKMDSDFRSVDDVLVDFKLFLSSFDLFKTHEERLDLNPAETWKDDQKMVFYWIESLGFGLWQSDHEIGNAEIFSDSDV